MILKTEVIADCTYRRNCHICELMRWDQCLACSGVALYATLGIQSSFLTGASRSLSSSVKASSSSSTSDSVSMAYGSVSPSSVSWSCLPEGAEVHQRLRNGSAVSSTYISYHRTPTSPGKSSP